MFRSRLGRTITDTDNIWFTTVTMNTNQVHFNGEFAAGPYVRWQNGKFAPGLDGKAEVPAFQRAGFVIQPQRGFLFVRTVA